MFGKLLRHDIAGWTLSGGIATELHLQQAGRQSRIRSLNDVDFITGSFEFIPDTLARDFLFLHVHPSDPPGKTLMQLVDTETALRLDVFRASGKTMERSSSVKVPGGAIRLIALADLLARSARLVLDLAGSVPIAAKYAVDFLRLVELSPSNIEIAWQDQRRPNHPATFAKASRLLHDLIARSRHLLIETQYSRDVTKVCARCTHHPSFGLADPRAVLAVLGYC